MLAMKRKDGIVYGSIPGLARQANVTLEECEVALKAFLHPDPYSRTKEHEGRRIEEVDGGWLVLNAAKFDAMRSAEERRDYMRDYQRKRRAVNFDVNNVSDVNRSNPNSNSTNSISKDQKKRATPADFCPPDWIHPDAWDGFVEMRKRERHPLTDRACTIIVNQLAKLQSMGQNPNDVLDQSTANGWRSVFELKIDRPTGKQPIGKTAQAINNLEALKREQQSGNTRKDAAPSLLELGGSASGGDDRRNG